MIRRFPSYYPEPAGSLGAARWPHRGFTLIELLVVIAIISVLIALLLARGAVGARGGAAGPVRQQPDADWASPCRAMNRATRCFPPAWSTRPARCSTSPRDTVSAG